MYTLLGLIELALGKFSNYYLGSNQIK